MMEVYVNENAVFFYFPEAEIMFSYGLKTLRIQLMALGNVFLPTRLLLEKRGDKMWAGKSFIGDYSPEYTQYFTEVFKKIRVS